MTGLPNFGITGGPALSTSGPAVSGGTNYFLPSSIGGNPLDALGRFSALRGALPTRTGLAAVSRPTAPLPPRAPLIPIAPSGASQQGIFGGSNQSLLIIGGLGLAALFLLRK